MGRVHQAKPKAHTDSVAHPIAIHLMKRTVLVLYNRCRAEVERIEDETS